MRESVYFAAGSFEPEDFPDGKVDLHFNMAREVLEETGLDIGAAPRDAGCHALATEQGTVIFRRYFLDADADEIAAASRFRRRRGRAGDFGPVVIRGRGRPAGRPDAAHEAADRMAFCRGGVRAFAPLEGVSTGSPKANLPCQWHSKEASERGHVAEHARGGAPAISV